MLTTQRTDRIVLKGDSLTGRDTASGGYLDFEGVLRRIRSRYETPVPTGTAPREPTFTNLAANGATTTTQQATWSTEVSATQPTVAFFQIGINDATTAIPRATTNANMTSMVGAEPAGCRSLIIGPHCSGELWPTGQNANDTAIVNIDADMNTLAQGDTVRRTFVSPRHSIYDVEEPLLNSASPGVDPGPLNRSGSEVAPSKHGNATMVKFETALVMAQIAFGP